MITSTVRDGIAVAVFDTPGEKVNVLSTVFLGEFEAELDRIAADGSVRGLVLASAKPDCFLAGADLKAMRGLMTAADPRAEGERIARAGHRLMAKIEAFRVPVLAAIGGVCLGGGTELALACRYRIASAEDATKIGLPEVKLGILPGWGGTVRLPELVGVRAALDLIMTGRELAARQAVKIGLVDETAPGAILHEAAVTFLARALKDGGARVRAKRKSVRGVIGRLLIDANPLVRPLVCAYARRSADAKTHGAYPAPLRAARVLGQRGGGGRAAAFDREAAALGDLLATPEARSLLGLFFLTQEAKAAGPAVAPRPVRAAAVVGGGLMGSGIATVFANRTIPVRIKDVGVPEMAKSVKIAADHFR